MTSASPMVSNASTMHVAGPGGGRSAWYAGWLVTFLATGAETEGTYSLTEVAGWRGHSAAPPMHVHTREEECFYVLEGAIICCAYAPAPGAHVTSARVRDALARLVPAYMLPARWMCFDALPKNANGKIDRRALKERFEHRDARDEEA